MTEQELIDAVLPYARLLVGELADEVGAKVTQAAMPCVIEFKARTVPEERADLLARVRSPLHQNESWMQAQPKNWFVVAKTAEARLDENGEAVWRVELPTVHLKAAAA